MRAAKVESLSNGNSTVYKIGQGARWYISVNHGTRRCQMTSGDDWFPVSREDAAKWIFNVDTAP